MVSPLVRNFASPTPLFSVGTTPDYVIPIAFGNVSCSQKVCGAAIPRTHPKGERNCGVQGRRRAISVNIWHLQIQLV